MASKGPAFRENIHRLFDEAQSTDLAPGIVSLIESRGTHAQIREVPVSKILPNPAQPRLTYDEESLTELAASIREHGVLQPILVRPSGSKFELIAGERRWRASSMAERETIPAIVAEFDDQTALEVSIIENLQREDVSPLEEATMFRKMTETFGYSLRQLAQKVGKDKGYIENRLRLTDAPADVRELVSVRKDTISHAYELMKIGDERKRRRLEKRIVAGELSLAKLRLITGTTAAAGERRQPRRAQASAAGAHGRGSGGRRAGRGRSPDGREVEARRGHRRPRRHPSPAGAPRADPRGQPVELREAPDDHEAQDRERDRDHPRRGPQPRRASRQPPSGDVAHHLAIGDEEVDQLLLGLRVGPAQAGDRLRQLEDRRRQRSGRVDADDVVRSPADEEGALEAALVEPGGPAERRDRRADAHALGEVHEQVGGPGVHLAGVLVLHHLPIAALVDLAHLGRF